MLQQIFRAARSNAESITQGGGKSIKTRNATDVP